MNLTQPLPNFREIRKDLAAVVNKHSIENHSNTPDFILAEFLACCMFALNQAIKQRDEWYGVRLSPGMDKSKFPSPVEQVPTPEAVGESPMKFDPPPVPVPRENHFEDVLDQICKIIGTAMGAASLCWNPRPTGVFDATECEKHLEVARLQIKELLRI